MRLTLSLLALCLVMTGCAFSPPKPKQCEGEFRPVNEPAKSSAATSRDQNIALCTGGGNVQNS